MKTINDFRNDLLKRRELKVIASLSGSPSFEASSKMMSDEFKVPEDRIVVKAVRGKFGRDTFLIDSYVYDSEKDKVSIEPRKKEKKKDAAGGAK